MTHEDADVVKIRTFVTKCLESVGALVDFPRYNYAEVLLPEDFADYFDGQNYFSLTFDFDVAKEHEDSELVTYGSYFLDRVIDLATQRGLACKRHILDDDVEARNLAQKIKGKIIFRNCRGAFFANAPVIYHYILFNFRVSYISDERVDRIVKVLVNLNNGYVDDEMLNAVESVIFTDSSHTNYTVEETCSVEEAYQLASKSLEEKIQPTIRKLTEGIRNRLAGEKRRITEYYDQIDGELEIKRSRLMESEHKEGIKSIDDKLKLSQIERQRRLNEIEEKNALKVSVRLFNATMISQTKIRNRYEVKRGKANLNIHVVWNPVLNDIEPMVCQVCKSATMDVDLCSNNHLGCSQCVDTCSVCSVHLCSKCGMTECSVCADSLCGECKTVCENCGSALCEKHIDLCTCKEEERRKKAEEAERKERKKREKEEKIREEHIRELLDIPLKLSKSEKQYHEKYVRANVDALDQGWKKLMAEAQKVLDQGEGAKIRYKFQQINSKYPPNAWVMSHIILSYKGWSQKMLSLARAVELAPNMALAHFALGHMHEKNGDYIKARESYNKAVGISGDDENKVILNGLVRQGYIFRNSGDWFNAVNKWKEALSINPRFEPARQALKGIYR